MSPQSLSWLTTSARAISKGLLAKTAAPKLITSTMPASMSFTEAPDPMTNNYRYKLGRGVVTKVGESPYKHEFVRMSLKPRNVV